MLGQLKEAELDKQKTNGWMEGGSCVMRCMQVIRIKDNEASKTEGKILETGIY